MKLAERMLSLHDGIHEVFILEDRAGQFVVIEEATRRGITVLADSIEQTTRNAPLAPGLILGAATKFSGESKPPRMVGILYDRNGLVLSYIDETRILALSTTQEDIYNVMQTVDDALPTILGQYGPHEKSADVVKSATDAENIARYYVASRIGGAARIVIDEVTYQETFQRWEVSGLYRAIGSFRSKRFQLEVDSDSGSVMKFGAPSSSPWPVALIAEFVAILGALSLLAWLLYLTFWK